MSDHDEHWRATVRAKGDHREFVGPSDEYDVNGALQFSLLALLGMRESHVMLDIGCGSLRGGRFFIMYLRSGHYYGIEPEPWLVQAAIRDEVGDDLVKLKSPTFYHGRDFACQRFGRQFDFVLAQGVFTHAPQSAITRCVSEAAGCMVPASLFVATFMEGDSDYDGSEWLYPRVSRYTSRRIGEIAEHAGLRSVPIPWPHPRGATWVALCRPEGERYVADLVGRLPSPGPCAGVGSADRAGAVARRSPAVFRSLVRRGTSLTVSLRRRMLGR